MDAATFDFSRARALMVDGQLRPNKVTDPRILHAMGRLPRERFLPPRLAAHAYTDADIDLGNGRALIAPMAIARLLQLTEAKAGERALVIGAGAGYGATVLAGCGARVTALDDDEALLSAARPLLLEFAPSVAIVSGRLSDGWAAGAPFDIVLIEGAFSTIPAKVCDQVRKIGGRLVGVRAKSGGIGHAVLGEPSAGGLTLLPMFDCGIAELPALRAAPSFVL